MRRDPCREGVRRVDDAVDRMLAEIGLEPGRAAERHLLHLHTIDVLVCKASGGAATEAKLIAAREISLPVIMVRRPPAETGESVETVEAALAWLGRGR